MNIAAIGSTHERPKSAVGLLSLQSVGKRGFGVKRLMDLPMAWPDQWSALGLRAPAER